MVANGISSLKRSVAVSAMVCGALAGCASTQQQVVQSDVPHPVSTSIATTTVAGPTTMSAVAYPTPASTGMTTAVVSKSDRVQPAVAATTQTGNQFQDRMGAPVAQPAASANGAQMAIATATGGNNGLNSPSASAAYASAEDAMTPAVVALPTARPGDASLEPISASAIAVSDNSIPMTPEMVAIQSVVPTPRPGESAFTATQVAFAAPAPQLAALTYDNNVPHYELNFDTTGPSVVPAVFEPESSDSSDDKVSPSEKGYISQLIEKYAKLYQVPAELIHRVVRRESRYDPKAFNHNGYFGLMQIKYNTAKSMGYEGPASGLFNAETNIKYAAKYLRGAWMVADNKQDTAVALYARGYYYNAKNKGMDDIANGNY